MLQVLEIRKDLECENGDSLGQASPVKWCLNEKVELPCKLAMPRLSSGVRKKRFC